MIGEAPLAASSSVMMPTHPREKREEGPSRCHCAVPHSSSIAGKRRGKPKQVGDEGGRRRRGEIHDASYENWTTTYWSVPGRATGWDAMLCSTLGHV